MNEKQIPLFDAGDRRILAVLFAAGEPLELERLAEGLGVDKAAMRQTLERLRGRLREAGLPFELLELEENVQLATAEEYGDLMISSRKRTAKLSRSARMEARICSVPASAQPFFRACCAARSRMRRLLGVRSSGVRLTGLPRPMVRTSSSLSCPADTCRACRAQ